MSLTRFVIKNLAIAPRARFAITPTTLSLPPTFDKNLKFITLSLSKYFLTEEKYSSEAKLNNNPSPISAFSALAIFAPQNSYKL